jgi:hypothetical protein
MQGQALPPSFLSGQFDRVSPVDDCPLREGQILIGPLFSEPSIAEDRRDCYWLYVVTHCNMTPQLQEPIKDPAHLPWHEVKKVDHYYLSVNAMTQPMTVREESPPYQGREI